MDVIRRDGDRPLDSLVVMRRLDDRAHEARRPDAVASHQDGFALAVFVGERNVERFGELGSQIENVADFDAGAAKQRFSVFRILVPFF